MTDIKLIGATCVYNEEAMIPFVMPYLEKMGYDKFVVYDDGCTDNTIEILKQYPFIEIRGKMVAEVDSFERRKLLAMTEVLNECIDMTVKNKEHVWFSFTDFDEVVYCQRDREATVKDFLGFMTEKGFNYYDGRMLHLTWDGSGEKVGLPHTWEGVRGSWWMMEGRKVLLIDISQFAVFNTFCGNHHMGVKTRGNVKLMNLADEGDFNSFHFKYFYKTLEKRDKEVQLVADANEATKNVRDCSFPLSDYFLMKGFFAQKTPPNKKDLGEGLVVV